VLKGKDKKVYERYLMKMNNMSTKNKNKLYLELADKINQFNKHSSRKLELFLGSKSELKRNLSEGSSNQIPMMNQNMQPQMMQSQMMQPQMMQPQMMQPQMMQSQMMQPQMMQSQMMQPQMMQPQMMSPQMMQPQMMQQPQNVMINQGNMKGKRKLFIEGLVGGLGNTVSAAAGSLTGGVSSMAKGLGANGGAGAGLLGAGAGLAMATMGGDAEREERDNLQQDLRSKEFRYMLEKGKKDAEMNDMDKHVRYLLLTN
jgi:hypothetical protein